MKPQDVHRVATASLAIFGQIRQVVREILQAKFTAEAQQLKGTNVAPCCQNASVRYVHIRLVSPQTLCGKVCIPVHTFRTPTTLRGPRRGWTSNSGRSSWTASARSWVLSITMDVEFCVTAFGAGAPPRPARDLQYQIRGHSSRV